MKSIDEKIAEAEAEWRSYRYRYAGVRESAGQLFRAVLRSAGKRMNCAVRNICSVSIFPVRKRVRFHPSYDKAKVNLVVSLTSTDKRIKYILPTLYSLASQTRKPDLIVLWLGKDKAYPKGMLSKIRETGILIRFREDLGPNTKYYYAFREYGKDVVITADDDIIYHKEMTEELYRSYLQYPDAVIARRVHKIRFDRDRKPVRYKDWIWEYWGSDSPSHDLFATGTGGVLYPPVVMGLKCWENRDFLKVCPKADDIWLKFCELKNGIRVFAVPDAGFHKDSVNLRTLKTSLSEKNIDRGRNDIYIRSCAQYFGFKDDLCERILGER
ncbi:MAG: glycosyltransferase [Lachnospiraceae bacterium]|nr:glycosyltransferase [Lachnospiraceae bacterium]